MYLYLIRLRHTLIGYTGPFFTMFYVRHYDKMFALYHASKKLNVSFLIY